MNISLKVDNIASSRGYSQLFSGLTFTVTAGQVFVIDGDNGSGKSTLLKIIAGLRKPDKGAIFWNGKSVADIQAEFCRQMVWLGHRNGLNPALTARENIESFNCLFKTNTVGLGYLLDKVGLTGLANLPVRQFSEGMKRRLALTRLMTKTARLWLLDEPQSALDRGGVRMLEQLIHEHVANQGMVIMSSHHDIQLQHIQTQYLYL